MSPATVLGAGLLCLAAAGPAVTQVQVIEHVNVVDVEAGRLLGPRQVVLDGDRIAALREVDAPVPDGAVSIDGRGRYLIPGLFDAHVHYMNGPDLYDPLLLAFGVTAVRDTGADTRVILHLREQGRQANSRRPTIFCTGAIVDGDPPYWPFSEACDEPGEGAAAVQKLGDLGVDQIKVYSRLPADVYREIITAAHARGLRVTGHVPASVSLQEALEAGQDCNEHLMGFPEALHVLVGEDFSDAPPLSRSWSVYPRVDREALRALADEVADAGMAQCPTLSVFRGYADTLREGGPDSPQLAYVGPSTRAMWREMGGSPAASIMREGLPHAIKLVGELHAAGVTILAGTDLANPYVYAGDSLHEELEYLEQAGLTPAEALRSATLLPARFCDAEADLGTVAPGRLASLVLLRENPLEDIRHTRSIEAVFLRGQYFDRAALDRGLAELAALNAGSAPATGDDPPAPEQLPGEPLFNGRYTMKYEQFDAGTEDFALHRTDAGRTLRLTCRPQGGPQTPFELTVELDGEFRFQRAWHRFLTAGSGSLEIAVADGALTVRDAGQDAPRQVLELGADAVVMPPGTAALGLALLTLGLEPGEQCDVQSVSWGYVGAQVYANAMQVTRDDDTRSGEGDAARDVQYYRTRTTTPIGEFQGEVWVTGDGQVVKSVNRMPFGAITTTLQE